MTLEDDLRRRDLTINAMAAGRGRQHHRSATAAGAISTARLLRHVSEAFVEDPVRILRVARFAARYAPLGFRVADETLALMQQHGRGRRGERAGGRARLDGDRKGAGRAVPRRVHQRAA